MKSAYSMWCWATLTMAVAITNLVAPHLLASAVQEGATPHSATLVMTRLLGIVMIGYAAGFAVAAASDGRLFMRVSVVLRASILPALLVMVALGWLPKILLALGLLDMLGALWTHLELRQRHIQTPAKTHIPSRSVP